MTYFGESKLSNLYTDRKLTTRSRERIQQDLGLFWPQWSSMPSRCQPSRAHHRRGARRHKYRLGRGLESIRRTQESAGRAGGYERSQQSGSRLSGRYSRLCDFTLVPVQNGDQASLNPDLAISGMSPSIHRV